MEEVEEVLQERPCFCAIRPVLNTNHRRDIAGEFFHLYPQQEKRTPEGLNPSGFLFSG